MNYTLRIEHENGSATKKRFSLHQDALDAYERIIKDEKAMRSVVAMSVTSKDGMHVGYAVPMGAKL